MDFVRSVLFAGLGLVLFLLGCGGGSSSCNAPTCDNGYYLPHLQSGTVSWTRNGAPLATVDVATDSSDGELAVLRTTPGKVDNPANPQPWRVGAPFSLAIAYKTGCGIDGCRDASIAEASDAGVGEQGPGWSCDLRISGDPRSWAPGEVTRHHASIGEHYHVHGGSTLMNGNPADLHVVVTEAAGGSSNFPALVTPDFLRVFQLDYTGVPYGDTQAHLSLTFALTAADFSARQELCGYCR